MKHKNTRIYVKNLEKFARDNPLEAFRLHETTLPPIEFCYTTEGELNLVEETLGQKVYLHDQYGAVWAAKQWAKKLNLEGKNVLFVYGLGLGYYYLPLKHWLEDSTHYLVFLEDDRRIIQCFLQTPLASAILDSPQVMVKLLPKVTPHEDGWAELRLAAAPVFWAFASCNPLVSALQCYFYSRFEYFSAFSLQWLSGLAEAERSLVEFYPNPTLMFHNFYANMPYLGEAIPGYHLAGTMQSIPAVLCGAGPSLTKQLPLLKTLLEKSFFMASGSAMNAITQAAIVPHAGGAIDPTSEQASRQLTSFAFDVPAFYQNRFFAPALTQWHGPLVYMVGSGAYRVSEWFEKELGIIDAEQIIMGVSTSNFLLEIANFLGCNPIILVGMDLAYTDDSRYAKAVMVHPTEDKRSHETLHKKQERVIAVPDVHGQDVYTTNQWFYEAVCIGAFQGRNPEVLCVNATEGGMAIPNVPNATFSDVVTELTYSWDIQGLFHGAIQNAEKHKIPLNLVLKAMNTWKKSLEACVGNLSLLLKHPKDSRVKLWQLELGEEPAYEYLLQTINTVFETLNSLRIRKLKWMKRTVREEQALEKERYQFLLSYAKDHLQAIDAGMKSFEARQAALAKKVEQKGHLTAPIPAADDAINSTKPHGEKRCTYYPDGVLKVEAFYLKDKLHGPWSFFSPEGKLLYRSGFVEGKRAGKSYAFYADGALYSLLSYENGVFHGQQFYYYADGTLKAEESYEKGLLHGVVRLYYSNGLLKKEQHFSKGHLRGKERLWNEWGKLTIEADH